jgi:tetratricopeptide (TPR) repeat protein
MTISFTSSTALSTKRQPVSGGRAGGLWKKVAKKLPSVRRGPSTHATSNAVTWMDVDGCHEAATTFDDPRVGTGQWSGPVSLGRLGLVMGVLLAFVGRARAGDSLAVLSARLAQEPDNGALYLRRASLHRAEEDVEAALADLELAAALPGGGALAEVRAGRLLTEAGRYSAAVERFDAALARAPGYREARSGKAAALWQLGEHVRAGALFESLFAEGEGEPELYEDYARLLAMARPPQLGAAVEILDRALVRFGPIPTLALPAIDLELRLGRWTAALRHLDALLAVATRRDYLLRRRGEILERAGRRCEAVRSYRAALGALGALSAELTRLPSFTRARAELEELARGAGRGGRCG